MFCKSRNPTKALKASGQANGMCLVLAKGQPLSRKINV
jgi:hypothetical protein